MVENLKVAKEDNEMRTGSKNNHWDNILSLLILVHVYALLVDNLTITRVMLLSQI
jgi:hypothetical protein